MSISYWAMNEVYILIALTIFVLFIISIQYLYQEFQITIARQLNDCTNPIAIYFDKDVRNKCLTQKLANNKGVKKIQQLDRQMQSDARILEDKFGKLDNRTNNSLTNFEETQKRLDENEAPALLAAKQKFMDLSGVISNVKKQYKENRTNLSNLVEDYEKTFNKNVEFVAEVGNSLVNKLYSNIYTKKFETKRKALVDNYNSIKAYLAKMVEMKQVDPKVGTLRDLTKDEINGKR
jgi:hypothetical protein